MMVDSVHWLVNLLGFECLEFYEYQIVLVVFVEYGLKFGVLLFVMMLDIKCMFDVVVQCYVSDFDVREWIFWSLFYEQVFMCLVGSQEYMVMEKFYELYIEGCYDLLILDIFFIVYVLDFFDVFVWLEDFMKVGTVTDGLVVCGKKVLG